VLPFDPSINSGQAQHRVTLISVYTEILVITEIATPIAGNLFSVIAHLK
tara:strand:- start:11859 stop:12005 length:147 start_codon:yes stop_codon:yes gene_type:complete